MIMLIGALVSHGSDPFLYVPTSLEVSVNITIAIVWLYLFRVYVV